MTITLREITEENYADVLAIRLTPEQEERRLVAPVVRSLADAWLYRHDGDTFPYAVYDEKTVVGFLLLDKDVEDRQFLIWRLIIDQHYQGQGYGTQVVQEVIRQARLAVGIEKVVADYRDGNDVMQALLESVGFVKTGYLEEWYETVMTYDL